MYANGSEDSQINIRNEGCTRRTRHRSIEEKNVNVLQPIEISIMSNERGSRWGRNLHCTTTCAAWYVRVCFNCDCLWHMVVHLYLRICSCVRLYYGIPVRIRSVIRFAQCQASICASRALKTASRIQSSGIYLSVSRRVAYVKVKAVFNLRYLWNYEFS